MHGSLTLSQLTAKTSTKARRLQNWTSKKVLRPEAKTLSRGTGIHRLYSQNEVEIAAIISEISRYGLPVWMLRGVADWLRQFQQRGKKYGLTGFVDGDRYVREQRFKLLRKTDIQGERSDAWLAEQLGLDHVPPGEAEITNDDLQELEGWVTYEKAKRPGSEIVMFLTFSADKWSLRIHDSATLPGNNEKLFGDSDSYLVIRIDRIISRLWQSEN
jgi:DNA-binding transcriptional MerR regulator